MYILSSVLTTFSIFIWILHFIVPYYIRKAQNWYPMNETYFNDSYFGLLWGLLAPAAAAGLGTLLPADIAVFGITGLGGITLGLICSPSTGYNSGHFHKQK